MQAGVGSIGLVKTRFAEVATVAAVRRNSISRACTAGSAFVKLVGTFALLLLIVGVAMLVCRFTLLTLGLAIFFPSVAEPGVVDARFVSYLSQLLHLSVRPASSTLLGAFHALAAALLRGLCFHCQRLGGLTFRRLKEVLLAFVFSTLLFCVRHLICFAKLFQAHHFHAAEA
jgi:hypothetical protein